MKYLLQKDKKGLSAMIGYVLLIVITIGIAAVVWNFLNFYLPNEREQCPDDVSIVVSEIDCSAGEIDMILENRGLFSIDGAYVKIGNKSRIFKETLCFEGVAGEECSIFFHQETTEGGRRILTEGLLPGERLIKTFSYTLTGEMELEIEPIIFVNEEQAVCKNALVSTVVSCV